MNRLVFALIFTTLAWRGLNSQVEPISCPLESPAGIQCETKVLIKDVICPDNGTTCLTEVNCPEQYQWNATSGNCVHVVHTCAEGYGWNGTACVVRPEASVCPVTHFRNRTTGQCQAYLDCPFGHIFNGTSCILTPTCPYDYVWNETLCVRISAMCPTGFIRKGNRCEQASVICPTGYGFNGKRCVSPAPVCPYNHIWDAERSLCIRPAICPPGYDKNGTSCLQNVYVCPRNFHFDGVKCIRRIPLCPPGFSFNTTIAKCIQTTIECKGGWLVNGTCQPSDLYCPDGYRLVGNRCLPIFNCTGGVCECPSTYRPANGTCIPDDRPIQCLPGSVLVNGFCIPNRTFECPNGYVRGRDGVCRPIEICEPGYRWIASEQRCRPICGPGEEWQNGVCVSRPICQDGYFWDSQLGTCVSQAQCPPNYVFENGICVYRPGCQPGTRWSDMEGRCVVDRVCPIDWVLKDGRCVPRCPVGEVFRNGRCERIRGCVSGTIWSPTDGRCVIEVRPCGPGTVWSPTEGRCVIEARPCGPGFRFDTETGKCVVEVRPCGPGTVWSPTEGRCVIEARPCGPGFRFDTETGKCVVEVRPCVSGTVWSPTEGRCVIEVRPCGPGFRFDAETGKCVSECPPDQFFVDGRCVPIRTCIKGTVWNEKEGRCVKECGPGFVFKDGKCQPEVPTCTPGLVWSPTEGRCVPKKKPTECPSGEVFVDGRCVPIRCPPGTSYYEGLGCVKLVCPPGTILRDGECVPADEETVIECPSCKTEVGPGGEIPITNIVNNNNTVDAPTNISTVNMNNIAVYLGGCGSGQFRTVIVRNNETQTIECPEDKREREDDGRRPVPPVPGYLPEDDDYEEGGEEDGGVDGESRKKCCSVISPRKCNRQGEEWVCFNRRYRVCGAFCTRDVLYLKPKRKDCSACSGGGGIHCYTECYRDNPCQTSSSCSSVDYEQFCQDTRHSLCDGY